MKYFFIWSGLRGCYMPDNSQPFAFNTRRDLKATLENEAWYLRDAGYKGLSKRAITWLAAEAWRASKRKNSVDIVAPCGLYSADRSYALGVTTANRSEYLEAIRDMDAQE